MLKIGDFSKLSRISIRMLRHYDEMELLVPASTDDFTGYRYYNETQLPIAARITSLKYMGFSLSVIAQILKNYDNPQALSQFLEVKQEEVSTQANEIKQRLKLLETAINQLRKDGIIMNYNVTLKVLPERYVTSVRKVISSYNQEGVLWGILNEETSSHHLQVEEPCYSLAIFHDGEYKESDVDVEVQISVKGEYKNTENVIFKTVAPIQIASATYTGGYEKITEVNEAVANWVKDNGYEFSGPNFCIYHVSPAQTQNPEELVTEVCYPVTKK